MFGIGKSIEQKVAKWLPWAKEWWDNKDVKESKISFGDEENILKLTAQLCGYNKSYWIVHFKWVLPWSALKDENKILPC